ncbi:7362_t:CDS:1, partial [Racocetra fulgida]
PSEVTGRIRIRVLNLAKLQDVLESSLKPSEVTGRIRIRVLNLAKLQDVLESES